MTSKRFASETLQYLSLQGPVKRGRAPRLPVGRHVRTRDKLFEYSRTMLVCLLHSPPVISQSSVDNEKKSEGSHFTLFQKGVGLKRWN
jgi:hypothetical protein